MCHVTMYFGNVKDNVLFVSDISRSFILLLLLEILYKFGDDLSMPMTGGTCKIEYLKVT